MSVHLQWTYTKDEEIWRSINLHGTKEAAALAGIAEYGDDDFWVGQLFTPSLGIHAENVLDQAREDIDSEFSEWSDGYLEDVSDEHLELLESRLNEVLNDWASETGNEPTFFRVEHITLVTGGAS